MRNTSLGLCFVFCVMQQTVALYRRQISLRDNKVYLNTKRKRERKGSVYVCVLYSLCPALPSVSVGLQTEGYRAVVGLRRFTVPVSAGQTQTTVVGLIG